MQLEVLVRLHQSVSLGSRVAYHLQASPQRLSLLSVCRSIGASVSSMYRSRLLLITTVSCNVSALATHSSNMPILSFVVSRAIRQGSKPLYLLRLVFLEAVRHQSLATHLRRYETVAEVHRSEMSVLHEQYEPIQTTNSDIYNA